MTKRLEIENPKVKYITKVYKYDETQQINANFYLGHRNGTVNHLRIAEKGVSFQTDNILIGCYYIDDVIIGYSGMSLFPYKNKEYLTEIVMPNYGKKLDIIPFKLGEERKYFFVNERSAIVIDAQFSSATEVVLPKGEKTLLLNGRLFVLSGDNVIFTEEISAENITGEIKTQGIIPFSEADGGVVDIFNVDNSLMIICKSNVYVLDAFGKHTNFSMQKLSLPIYEVIENTCVQIEDAIYFIGNTHLYHIKDKKLYSTKLKMSNYLRGHYPCACFKNYYLIPINDPHIGFVCVDTISGREDIFPYYDYISPSGGHILNGNDVLYLFENSKTPQSLSADKFFSYFGTKKRKHIKDITIECDGTAQVNVYSDENPLYITLEKGINHFNCNLLTKYLEFYFNQKSPEFFVHEMKFCYRIFE